MAQQLEASGNVQQTKFTSALLVVALLLVAALVAGALYEVNRSQREAQERAANEIDSLARVFAEQTRRSLQTVDILLRRSPTRIATAPCRRWTRGRCTTSWPPGRINSAM